ncbi:hypothetical protein CVT26_013473 [Gymnopilus dilepis]|uniref:Uncharacterized protein n=1 Tax=Gymnopilus dilepis TaxID=231916 RepID=A0A409YWU7_9AGAR|nr:hypothetical protein CVT26_013473 [Gymnopilus dilepis]
MSQAPSASTTEPGLQSKVKKPFHKAKVWFKDHFSSGRSLPSTSPNSRSSTPRPEATDEGRRPLQAVQSSPAFIPTPSSGPLSTTPMGHELFTAPSATLDSQPPTVAAPLNMPAMPPHAEGGHLNGSGSSDGPVLDAIFSPMAVAMPGTTEPSRSEPDLKPHAPVSPVPKDRFGTVLNVVSQVLKVATAATAFFPPAQSAIGGVSGAVDMVKV